MDDLPNQLRRDIACARRVVNGVTDTLSRRVLRDYIRELETKLGERTTGSRTA